MKIIKKIGFFIAEPRQIDYYQNILKMISNNILVIIINDLEHNKNSDEYKKILKFCNNNNYQYFNSKDLIKKNQKVLLVIGTGNTSYHNEKINFIKSLFGIIKFFYAKTIGTLIEKIKLNILFTRLFNKNLTMGGQNAKLILSNEIPPESVLGYKKLLFPRGMDIYYNHPGPMRAKYFDYFFSISKFDDDYIKKNSNKKSFIIGYPRYDTPNDNEIDSDLKSKIDINKKNILWITSDMLSKKLKNQNIYLWFDYINDLTQKYNVIFRPHPKTLNHNQNLINKILKTDLILDTVEDRNLKNLYNLSHLVIADYGGPIFSALYCKKNVLLLNVNVDLKKTFKFDLMMRDYLYNIDIGEMNNDSLNKILANEKNFQEIKKKSIISRDKIFPTDINKMDFNEKIYEIFNKENEI
mgnify:CR=1 FL=1